jgi:hypothetical protein
LLGKLYKFLYVDEEEGKTLAKTDLNKDTEATQAVEQPVKTGQPQAQQPQQQAEVVVNETTAHAAYANFARVTATPEEVIVDFGLNPQPFATGRQEVNVSQRLIMNFYTAKRLLGALQMTIQRHEGAFGAIELDVRRRANVPGGGTGPANK